MAEADSEPRTEEPSARRREQARQLGQVGRSAGLTAAVALLSLVLCVGWLGERLARGLAELIQRSFRVAAASGMPAETWPALAPSYAALLSPVGLLLLAIAGGAIVAGLGQVGGRFTLRAVSPARPRPSAARALREMFSGERVTFGVLALVQWLLLAAVVAWVVAPSVPGLQAASLGGLADGLAGLAALLLRLMFALALAGVFVGAVDLVLRRVQVAAAQRMGRRERMRERREEEGDPALRAERRRLHAELATLADLVRARVLVMDTGGWAVALAYGDGDSAPRVIARGRGGFAEQMQRRCLQLGVPVAEAAGLARALFRHGPGEPIGREHYEPVAALLREDAA